MKNVDGTIIELKTTQEVFDALKTMKTGIEQEQDPLRKAGLSKWFADLTKGINKGMGEEAGKKAVEALTGLATGLPKHAAQYALIQHFMGH